MKLLNVPRDVQLIDQMKALFPTPAGVRRERRVRSTDRRVVRRLIRRKLRSAP
jgi:hypothetical protein